MLIIFQLGLVIDFNLYIFAELAGKMFGKRLIRPPQTFYLAWCKREYAFQNLLFLMKIWELGKSIKPSYKNYKKAVRLQWRLL